MTFLRQLQPFKIVRSLAHLYLVLTASRIAVNTRPSYLHCCLCASKEYFTEKQIIFKSRDSTFHQLHCL